ncbi:MAG: Secretion system C-terminal sorting domain [Bacteroidota bacterium]|jgi:hypothetical protein
MRIVLSLTFGFLGTISFAQSEIQNNILATSGTSLTNGTIVIDFTTGESFTSTFSLGTNYIITQGFQQPFSSPSGASLNQFLNEDFAVYPNPFQSELVIRIPENEVMEMLIYDNAGRIVYKSTVSKVQSIINLSQLENAHYQLVLRNGEKILGIMSLIKSC